MNIDLADVTIHIDETLESGKLTELERHFRERDGVISVHYDARRPHLFVLEYNPRQVNSRDLVSIAHFQGLHAELVGL